MLNSNQANVTVPFSLDAEPALTLTYGLSYQWLFKHQAVMFVAEHSERALVDAWIGKLTELATTDSNTESPLFILCDFSGKNCVSTPYAREKLRKHLGLHTRRKGIVAMVVQDSLNMQLSRLFIRAIRIPNYNANLFFKVSEGLIWLHKHVQAHQQAPHA
jgi:hypothetical protein